MAWEYHRKSQSYRLRALVLSGILTPENVELDNPDLIDEMVKCGELI